MNKQCTCGRWYASLWKEVCDYCEYELYGKKCYKNEDYHLAQGDQLNKNKHLLWKEDHYD
jgi:hypothetical protein